MRLIGIADRNGYQLDGAVDDVIGIEPLADTWRSFGWATHGVDGHDLAALTALLRRVKADEARRTPCCIIARLHGNRAGIGGAGGHAARPRLTLRAPPVTSPAGSRCPSARCTPDRPGSS